MDSHVGKGICSACCHLQAPVGGLLKYRYRSTRYMCNYVHDASYRRCPVQKARRGGCTIASTCEAFTCNNVDLFPYSKAESTDSTRYDCSRSHRIYDTAKFHLDPCDNLDLDTLAFDESPH